MQFQVIIVSAFILIEMEKKLLEERSLKQKVENLLLEAEKRCSILDCDLKQSQQKLNELLKQKDVLNEDVSVNYSKEKINEPIINLLYCGGLVVNALYCNIL
jgi:hypothetical protein